MRTRTGRRRRPAPSHALAPGRTRATSGRIALVVALVLGVGGALAASTTAVLHCVNPNGDAGCVASVQAAVDAAAPGDTVSVAAGTYAEDVTIDKSLTLAGAGAAVDARTRSASETVLRSVAVTASDVTVAGFTFDGTGAPQIRATGAVATLSGVVVENDIFQGYDSVAIVPDDAGNIVIRRNLFASPGPSAEPMQVKNNLHAGGCAGTSIVDNRFVDATTNGSADVNLSCSGSNVGLTVSGNRSTDNTFGTLGASFVSVAGVTDGITITGNTAATDGSTAFFWGGVTGTALVDGNDFHGGSGTEPAVSLHGAGYGAHTGTFTITGNDLSGHPRGIAVASDALGPNAHVVARGNDLSSTGASTGVDNSAPTTVDARQNWWGSTTGPTVSANPGGTGTAATAGVTFSPWCTSAGCTTLSNTSTLLGLDIVGVSLSPAFDPAVTSYVATVGSGTSSLDVNPAAAPGSTADVTGGTSLGFGTNTVTVSTTSVDGTAHTTYTVTVERTAPAPQPPSGPPPTSPPVTTPPPSAPPVTAPPNSTAPVAAPARPGQSGSAVVDVPAAPVPTDAGGGPSTPAPPPVKVAVAWPPTAFKEPVTVTVTPRAAPTSAPPTGAAPSPTPSAPGEPAGGAPSPPPVPVGGGLSLGSGNAVVSLNVTNDAGEPVTTFEAPLEITISASAAGDVPAYSRNGTTWTTIPRLASLPIPEGQSDGYFVNADRSVTIFTRHATFFGLLTDAQAPVVRAFGIVRVDGGRRLRFVWNATDNVGLASLVLADGPAIVGVYPSSATEGTLPHRDGNYRIAAVDRAGNVARSGLVSVHGATVVHDTTRPTPPHLQASIRHKSTLRLRWSASRDQTAVTYVVYRDGRLVLRTTKRRVTMRAAQGHFTVDAVDQVDATGEPGHRSTSNAVRVTRPSVHGRPWRAWPSTRPS